MKFIKKFDKTAIIFGDEKISYLKLLSNVKNYTEYLHIEEGEKVAIFSENRPEYVYAFLGIWQKKGICNPIDAANNYDELLYVLKDSEPKFIFVSNKTQNLVKKVIEENNLKIKIINYEEIELKSYKEEELEEIYLLEPEKVCLILYTSGTTGDPKGVMLTQDNIIAQIESLDKYKMYEKSDVFISLLPLHHILPLLGTAIMPLYFGATIVFLQELSSDKIKEALIKNKVTMFIGVPRLYEVFYRGIMAKIEASKISTFVFNLAKKINSEKIRKKLFKKIHDGFGGNIKFLISGGAKLDLEISKAFSTFGFKMVEGYGMTETAPIISFTKPNNIKNGKVGSPLDGVEVKISDEGEILVKGRNVMKGYYKKEKETREIFTEDGWLKTGDLGEIDEDNYIKITGRKKEMIVLSNGKNIDPVSVEQEILRFSKGLIEEIGVIDNNNHLNAIIYPNFNFIKEKEISNISETIKNSIIEKYNIKALPYKKILDFKITQTELPKTKLGKLRRFKLKELLHENETEKNIIEEPSYREYKVLKDFISTLSTKIIKPTSHLELDLALDSLDMVELKAFISTAYGVDISDKDFTEHMIVEEMAKYLKEKSNTNVIDTDINWKEILNKGKNIELPKTHILLLFFKYLTSPILKLYFRFTKKGIERLSKKTVIFVGNHQSFVDSFAILSALPNKILKNTYFLAKIKHFDNRVMKSIANRSNIVIVDINKNLKETLQESAEILKKGKNLVIFPEGTRTVDGNLGEFKKAFAILSKELGVDIQPFVIRGAYKSMPRGKKIPRPTKIELEFLEKISPKNLDIEVIVKETRTKIDKILKK
ncbi:long-chain acyl-CoA synthetase [Hypnocyclicus thermotrophus]|uniref:Long-chain acyl-CoA synthetase n=1 Tax=Hypnocyclicus thermotrophus TaxID=1627895 RepID=A0AA46DZY9_9FUSO|nr:AMP-binding protein [Hypnocyclicus thermotrophus]TDT72232.1 long-chain acyl-CoA synthetase [Hypnocyclicus thermotrophus]